MRTRDHDDWRAPGCASGPDPVVAAVLVRFHDALTALSLTGLSDEDVARVLDAGTAASARTTAVLGRAGWRPRPTRPA